MTSILEDAAAIKRLTEDILGSSHKCSEGCGRYSQGGDWRPEMCVRCAEHSLCEDWRDDEGRELKYGD